MNDLENTAPSFARLPTGIAGLDEITGGGLPLRRTSLLVGGPGTGKTVFALQTLANCARQSNVPGIFVAFEENAREIIANAASFGWDLPALEKENKLFFLDAHLSPDVIQAGDFDLAGLLAVIQAKAGEMGATLIAFDSVDLLLAPINDPVAAQRECYRLREWLLKTGLTGLLTAKTAGGMPFPSAFPGISFAERMAFMADCVLVLQQQIRERVAVRDVRVAKYRGGLVFENEFPMMIDADDGILINALSPEEGSAEVPVERLSSGVAGLDSMLGGGYFRASSVLITGAPGVAKSTLAGAFAEAACRRGEATLYVSFDQKGHALVRSLNSVGIDLASHIAAGTLLTYAAHGASRSIEEHMLRLVALMQRHQTRCMVIDSISAPFRTSARVVTVSVAEQLLHYAWVHGITVVCTSLAHGTDPFGDQSVSQISSIADTWIHLSYLIQAGEFNRALAIIKSRGTDHDHRVHELILSDSGLSVVNDTYTAGGRLLMGSRRQEIECATKREEELMRELDVRRLEAAQLFAGQQAMETRLAAVQQYMAALRDEEKGA